MLLREILHVILFGPDLDVQRPGVFFGFQYLILAAWVVLTWVSYTTGGLNLQTKIPTPTTNARNYIPVFCRGIIVAVLMVAMMRNTRPY